MADAYLVLMSKPSPRFPRVLVSGASISGLTTAYWLAHHGFAVTVVERAPHLRPGGQALDVRGPALCVAERMGIRAIDPEWLGANIVIVGLPRLSMPPAGTLLFFAGGVTLKVDGQNGPCRIAGRAVAEKAGMDDVEAGALLFPKAARRLRGLVAWVEKPGRIEEGEALSARVPEQWVYR